MNISCSFHLLLPHWNILFAYLLPKSPQSPFYYINIRAKYWPCVWKVKILNLRVNKWSREESYIIAIFFRFMSEKALSFEPLANSAWIRILTPIYFRACPKEVVVLLSNSRRVHQPEDCYEDEKQCTHSAWPLLNPNCDNKPHFSLIFFPQFSIVGRNTKSGFKFYHNWVK